MSVIKNGLLRRDWGFLTCLNLVRGKKYIPPNLSYINPNALIFGGGETARMVDDDFEKKRDLILFVLKEVGEIEGRTRFQKMIFLGEKELGLPEKFEFKKHYYGPYSTDLAETIRSLVLRGEIKETISDDGYYIKYFYTLSAQGKSTYQWVGCHEHYCVG